MDVRVLAVAATALCGFSLNSSAAINDWTAIGPTGGIVNKIVFSKTANTVLMVGAGGIYRSQDGGVSWQLIKSDFLNGPVDVAIDPSDPTRVYAVAPNAPSLFVSTDGGSTFSVNTSLPTSINQARQIAVSQDGTTLYLTNYGRIFCSADRGQTWLERTAISADTSMMVIKLLIDPTDPKSLYAAVATASTGAEGIFATHDGAMTWQQLTSGTGGASLTSDLAINPANPSQIWSAQYDGVWVSADRGVHWSNLFSTAVSAIVLDPTNPAILYAGSPFGRVFRSANAGVNWSDVSGKISAGENIHIAINPVQTSQLLVGGTAGVSATTTSGNTWSAQQAGMFAAQVYGLSADPSTDRIYMGVPTGGIYYTANGSATTTAVNNDALLQLTSQINFVIASFLAQAGQLSVSMNQGIARSSDGGNTWDPLVTLSVTRSSYMNVMTSTPGAPLTILGANESTIYRTIDGGNSWAPVTTGLPASFQADRLMAAPSDPNTVYASLAAPPPSGIGAYTSLGVYKSLDAGNSWAPVNSNVAASATLLLAVDPTNASVLYGASDSTLLKSSDAGATWSALGWNVAESHGLADVMAIDPLHTNILYAASVARVGRSVDGGASWETLRDPNVLPFFSPNALIADPKRPENVLAATGTLGVQLMTISPDLALTVAAPAGPLALGAQATYTYTTTNLGPFDATGVKVSVQLPASAQGITAAASGGTCSVTALAATCTFAILRRGASTGLTLTATAPTAGSFQVSGSVQGDQPDSDPTNNSVSSSATVTTVSDMSVAATGSTTAHIGDAVSYTLVATNVGPNVAPAAQLTFQLAAGLTPGTVSSADATCSSGASGQVTCNLNDLAVAKAVTVTVNATAATVGTQTSTASVTSSATDLVSTNNTSAITTTVTAAPPPAPTASGHSGGGSVSIYEIATLLLVLLSKGIRGRRGNLRWLPHMERACLHW